MRIVLLAFSHIEYTIELAGALSKHLEVMLMLPRKRADRFSEVIDEKIRLFPYNQPKLRYPTNLIVINEIIRKIKTFSPDVIHLQHLFGEHPWFDIILPFLRKKYPFVITVHDVNLHNGDKLSFRIPFMYKVNKKYLDQVIVHGANLKKEMIKKYGNPPDAVHVLPRGVNSIYKSYRKNSVEEDKHCVLFFGRIWEYKGLRYLIEAEPAITRQVPEVKIVIAGTGENLEKYRKLMVHKDKFIIYDKHIPNDMVSELFEKSSVVVLPYTDASQSGVIPLAYAFKKPVVVTNVGSLPDVVDHGETGYIVPPKNSKKLAEAIIDLLKNDSGRKIMGENAYNRTKGKLSWDFIAKKTIEIYRRL